MKSLGTYSKMVLAATFAVALASPAFAHQHDKDICPMHGCPHKSSFASGSHVDTIKDDVAPHANVRGFKATGQLPTRNGDIYQKAECDCHAAKADVNTDRKAAHEARKEARKEHLKKMTPKERAAAKAKWEQKKKAWRAMTPEQKAAAKARWEQNHQQ